MKPTCDVGYCSEPGVWLVRNLETKKEHVMCASHSVWYTLPTEGALMTKERKL